jgi:uncharacterized protein (DUF736 family)
MAFETKPQTGALFANKVKKHPKAPDYQGDLLVDTRLMEIENGMMKIRLAGWKKQSASGSTFLSISVDTYKPKDVFANHAKYESPPLKLRLQNNLVRPSKNWLNKK